MSPITATDMPAIPDSSYTCHPSGCFADVMMASPLFRKTRTLRLAMTGVLSRADQIQFVKEKLRAVKERPSTLAAAEFFEKDDWESLPSRIERLCSRWDAWVRIAK